MATPRTDPASGGAGLATTGKLVGTFADAHEAAAKQPQNTTNHTSAIRAYVQFRVRDLLRSRWGQVERAWKDAWRATHLAPRFYINTDSIYNAALKDMMGSLVDSITVTVGAGQRISVSGAISLNPQAVLAEHNRDRSGMTKSQEMQIRFKGANPKTLGVIGSFAALKTPYLSAYLNAGPNTNAGSAFVRVSGTNLGVNVFRALGQMHYGVKVISQRGGKVHGDVLMEVFAYNLGFNNAATRTGVDAWRVHSSIQKARKGVVADIMTVVMEEVSTKFPSVQFEQ